MLRLRPDSRLGITVTHGIAPRFGDWDAYDMARCAVDEAVRGHVALGGDPDRMAGLDNFCWPDPVEAPDNPDGAYKLAQLVRACRGLAEACLAYGLPLVSGKDSMKNDARVGGRRISVRPTLLVSLMGVVPDVRRALTTDFKRPGDAIWLRGRVAGRAGRHGLRAHRRGAARRLPVGRPGRPRCGSTGASTGRRAAGSSPPATTCPTAGCGWRSRRAPSAASSGRTWSLDAVPADRPLSVEQLLFGETPGRLLVSVAPRAERRFRRLMRGLPAPDRPSSPAIGERDAGRRRVGHCRSRRRGGPAAMTIDEVRAGVEGRAPRRARP